ncbi:MAG: CoA-binding protein [Lutibacter sp.]|nr:CoA-binding protein [Lutibacter sp.]MDP3358882.1 CoA-binding protein [Lutibacter sp.]
MIKNTLVLGASTNPSRYSFLAIQKLTNYGHPVVAIGNKVGEVSGVKIITEKVIFENIDTVTLYLSKKNQGIYYDYIIGLNPKRIIFNPGTENVELENLLTKHHIAFEEACTLVLLSIGKY